MTDRPDPGPLPRRFDVANGDADGLCAVLQWRLAHPVPASLVTGVKRDIELLRHVPVDAADEVLVCDLSMLRNRDALVALLDGGVRVRWFDHHAVPQPMPVHPYLEAHVDLGPAVCTSVLVDRALAGASARGRRSARTATTSPRSATRSRRRSVCPRTGGRCCGGSARRSTTTPTATRRRTW